LTAKKPRKKKCRECRAEFIPDRPFQTWCGVECGVAIARAKHEKARRSAESSNKRQEKAERAATRAAKDKIKPKAKHMQEAQAAVNAWVRLRDAEHGCISCDKPADWQGQWHASHFKSVAAAPALRFEPLNIHKACWICNKHHSGNLLSYKPALIEKIGIEAFNWLEGPHEPKHYTIEDLQAIKAEYRAKVRELKKSMISP
jgi:hypothetical protein